jgi:hypothetical protein
MAEKHEKHKDGVEETGSQSDSSGHDTDDGEGELDDYDFGYVGDDFEDFDGGRQWRQPSD